MAAVAFAWSMSRCIIVAMCVRQARRHDALSDLLSGPCASTHSHSLCHTHYQTQQHNHTYYSCTSWWTCCQPRGLTTSLCCR